MFFLINSFAQGNDIWFRDCDTTDSANPCGYVDKDNHVKIVFGKYGICFTDTFKTYAIVTSVTPGEGLIAIDKQENKLFEVFAFDNGPDYVVEGAFRIVDNGKMGFADTTGRIIIPAIYDFAGSFDHGLALVNNGGKRVGIDPADPHCEYYTWKGGKWGMIDKAGKLIVPAEFDHYETAYDNDNLKIILQKDHEIVEIVKGVVSKKEKTK